MNTEFKQRRQLARPGCPSSPWVLSLGLLIGLASAFPVQASVQFVDKLMVVDCLLPGQVRKLGRQLTYLSQRRAVKTSGEDCEIRGGEYVAYDRANLSSALGVWLPLAQEGDAQAQTFVGEIFEKGLGVAPDYAAAALWYRKAADQNHARAQINLGHLYEKGLGVGKDPVAALNWYRRAAGIQDMITLGGDTAGLASRDAEIRALRKELEDTRHQLDQYKRDRDILERDNRELLQRKQAAQQANDQALVRQLEAQLQQRDEQARKQQVAMSRAQEDIQRYQAQLAKLNADRDRETLAWSAALEQTEAELASLRRELGKTRDALAQANGDRQRLEQDRNTLAGQLKDASRAGDKNRVRQLEALLAKREQDLIRKAEEMERMNQELASQREKVARVEIDRQGDRLARIDVEKQNSQEVQALRRELEATRRQLEKVIADQKQVEQDRQRLAQEKAQLVAQLKEATRAGDKDRVRQLEALLAKREQDIIRKVEELGRINQELAAQREQSVQLEVARQSERLARIEAEKQSGREAVALRKELDATRRQLEQVIADRKLVEQDRQRLAAEAERARLSDEPGRLKRLEDQLRQKEADLARQQERVAGVEKEALGYKQRLAQLERDIKALAGEPRSTTADAPKAPRPIPAIDYGGYYALVIGNEDYAHLPKLDTAIEDADEISKVLRKKFGFKVSLLKNATRYQILTELNKLRQVLTEKDNLLIYYAGHGELDRVNLRGHWLPVDAEADSDANWISNVAITDILNAMSAKHVLVVADSCYSGAMTRSSVGSLKSGMSEEARETWLKALAKARSRTVLTSGGLAPVIDGGGGRHSIFCKSLLDVLHDVDGVLEAQKLWQDVAARVLTAAMKYRIEQKPEYSPLKFAGHEAGDFLFVANR